MELFKNKWVLLILAAGAVLLVSKWLQPETKLSKDKVIAWVTTGYSNQFCKIIYPRIADCVSMKPNQCITVATSEINDCVNSGKNDLPDSANSVEAKQIYDSFLRCFQNKMHDEVRQNYMIYTTECQQRLS